MPAAEAAVIRVLLIADLPSLTIPPPLSAAAIWLFSVAILALAQSGNDRAARRPPPDSASRCQSVVAHSQRPVSRRRRTLAKRTPINRQPPDMPPFRFGPPPTSGDSSSRRPDWYAAHHMGETAAGSGTVKPNRERSFSREPATVCAKAPESETARRVKEMNFLSAHQSSNPTTPAMQSVSRTCRY
jgi:hypothetical protein